MFISIDGQKIFFEVVGEKLAADGPRMREKPTLIALHGGPGFDHTGLRVQLDALSDVAQVVYLDHRGNGRSVPSDPETWTLARWGDDIKAFCDLLGIEGPIVLGQSFGGMVAQSYATRHPGHARGLILSSTAAHMDLASSIKAFERMGGAYARGVAERFWNEGDDAAFDDYMRVCMPLYNTQSAQDGANARARSIMRREVYRHFSLPGCEMRRMDFRAALARVTCPTLVLAGEADPITPTHLAQEIFDHLPSHLRELCVFPRCGHGPFRDEPDMVLRKIRSYMENI